MKKVFAILLCICIVICIGACGADPTPESTTEPTPSTSTIVTPTTPSDPPATEESNAPTESSATENTQAPTEPEATESTQAPSEPQATESTQAPSEPQTTENTQEPAPPIESDPTVPEYHPMHAVIMPPIHETVTDEDGTLIFTKSYQKFQLVFQSSDVGDIVAQDLRTRMDAFLSSAADIESYARKDYMGQANWSPYYVSVQYEPTRIDHHVLSLYGKNTSFSGETRPSSGTESITYDLSTGTALTLGDILVAGYAGEDIANLICQHLTDWAGELYPDYRDVLVSIFKNNSGSITNWYFTNTGLTFHFSPSEIAPTFVGIVSTEIPYNSLRELLREQYFPTATSGNGALEAEEYITDDSERFTSIVQVELASGGKQILLYPDAPVADLRIEIGTQMADGSGYMTQTTIFCANWIDISEAIVLEADLSDPTKALQIQYRTGDQVISASLVYDAEGDTIILAYG